MDVTVRTYGEVREAVGEREVTLDLAAGSTVADLLSALAESTRGFDPENVGRADVVVSVDGTNVKQLDGRETGLSAGTVVSVSGSPMAE